MKKLFILFSLQMLVLSCSQNLKKKDLNSISKKENQPILTKDNYIETMLKQIKHYPKEPVYQVFVKNSLCLYEVLVNDFPVAKMYEYGQMMTPYDINTAILKSGKQKITLRLYPAPAEFSQSGDVLSPNTKCNLEIEFVDNKDPKYEYIPVTKFELPTKVRMTGRNNDVAIPEFEGEGKMYYEITYEFDASVPYENEGWSKGQDLTKLDQKKLKEATLQFYENQWKLFKNKKIDDIFSFLYNKERETTQASYDGEKDLINLKESYLKPFTINSFTLEQIQDYEYKFFGNGKIISLYQKSEDSILRSNSALWGKYKNENGSTIANFRNYYLYLPEGKKLEDGLEVIR